MQKRQVTSNRLIVNAGIIEWYQKELKKLAKQMSDECYKEITGIYKELGYQVEFATDESISSQIRIALNSLYNKFSDKFSKNAKDLVKRLINRTNKYSNMLINNAIKKMVGADNSKNFALIGSAISPQKEEVIKALIFDNVTLIKSISEEYFKQITGAIARSIESGSGLKELRDELLSYGAKSVRRADLIAQDQTRKAFTAINKINFQEAGIKKFKWLHSGGSREPRKYHMEVLNGQIFDIDEGAPNESGKKPDYIFPAELPYCRCVMQAVLDFEE